MGGSSIFHYIAMKLLLPVVGEGDVVSDIANGNETRAFGVPFNGEMFFRAHFTL